ncbi:MAG: hypothetical protein K0S25_1209 [Bacillus sp. (in: firmicutes)]|nr:hypothetical protein [Bacillus sp. (in: firmicutes)]
MISIEVGDVSSNSFKLEEIGFAYNNLTDAHNRIKVMFERRSMSRGLEAVYKLLTIENGNAIYAYSGDNFSAPYDKELARSYDGRIEITLSAFEEFNWDGKTFESGKIKITKNCYYAEINIFGVDIFALKTISDIMIKYKEIQEIPKEGHWIV